MPVTLRQINAQEERFLIGCQRVVQSNIEVPMLAEQWQEYWLSPQSFELWIGIFNDQVVGIALVQHGRICLLAVHRATQRRGVATRMIDLLCKEYSALQWPPSLERFIHKHS